MRILVSSGKISRPQPEKSKRHFIDKAEEEDEVDFGVRCLMSWRPSARGRKVIN